MIVIRDKEHARGGATLTAEAAPQGQRSRFSLTMDTSESEDIEACVWLDTNEGAILRDALSEWLSS